MTYLENFNIQMTGDKAATKKLVFLHGLMGSAANWGKITKAFEKDYSILAFDQRGHGKSFQPDSGYSPEDYADDLLQITEYLGWSNIDLIGHSMGGRNALVYASNHPERVRKLVVEDIGPEKNISGLNSIKVLLESVPVPFPDKAMAKAFFVNDFLEIHKNNPMAKTLSQYFYTNIADIDGQANWRFSLKGIFESLKEGHENDYTEITKNLVTNTLYIRGENSKEFSKDSFEKTLQLNNKITGVEIAKSGHWVHFDQPEEFIKQLKNFLDAE